MVKLIVVLRRRSQLIALGFLAASISACMLSPTDGQTIATTDTAVSFQGYLLEPTVTVTMEARHPGTGVFAQLGATTTSGTNPTTYDGAQWYGWTASRVVPFGYWTVGSMGRMARVRSRIAGATLTSVVPNYAVCAGDFPAVGDFLAHCAGKHDPEAYIYTSDYPRGVDLVLERMYFNVAAGEVVVDVWNGGRDGWLTGVECGAEGIPTARLNRNHAMLPNQRRTYNLAMPTANNRWLLCRLFGQNDDRSPEDTTCTAETIPRCDNNWKQVIVRPGP